MTSRKIQHRDITRENKPSLLKRAKSFVWRNCFPTLAHDIYKIKKQKAAGENVGRHPYKKAIGKYVARVGAATAVYRGSGSLYSVCAWDYDFKLSAMRIYNDSSLVAKKISDWIAEKMGLKVIKGTVSGVKMSLAKKLVLVETFGFCVARVAVDQFAFLKTGFTAELAGTLLTPIVGGVLEAITKATEDYPKTGEKLFRISTIGMWGNFVRIVHSGLIIAFGNRLWNKVKPKPPTDQGPDPTRNKYGYPIVRKDDNWQDGA